MENQKVSPKTLTLITTFRCSASCANCCFECSPIRKEVLDDKFAISIIKKAVSIFPSIKAVILTGGEAFLYFNAILKIVKAVNEIGLVCRIVTNGFWGKDKENSFSLLQKLKDAGLDEINFSTGDDHLEYVDISSLKNCVIAALSLGLKTVINLESGNDRLFSVSDLNNAIHGLDTSNLTIIRGMWMPFTMESITKLKQIPEKCMHPVMERCTNMFSGITVSPNRDFLSCCGLPVTYIKYFNMGEILQDNLYSLYKEQFYDFLKIWLYVEGPYKILSYIEAKTGTEIPELHVLSHMCFYCACLFTNHQYLKAAQRLYKDKYESVMIKFYLLTKNERKL